VLAIGNKKDGIRGLPAFTPDQISTPPSPQVNNPAPVPGSPALPWQVTASETSAVPTPAAQDTGFPFITAALIAAGCVGC
jgi:hypothetical protein